MTYIKLFIITLRPKQWTKNLLVFAALIFSYEFMLIQPVIESLIGFVLFCIVSGTVYILNDYVDRENDRHHPEKMHRPIASRALHPQTTLIMGIVLLGVALCLAFIMNVPFALLLLGYFLLNVAYSFWLKNIVIIDVMVIAAGFVLRAIGGGLVIEVPFTPWFLLCTMLLALFLAISKRRHEFMLFENEKGTHRRVLEYYSADLLNQLNTIVTTATIISYALFTFTSGHTIQLMWTIPFVIYGIFRYLYLINIEEKGGSPEKVLIDDKHILVTVILYGLTVVGILYYFN